MRRLILVVVCAVYCLLTAATAPAQIKLDRFYPPAIGIGEAATITAEGKFPTWPCSIYCDRDDIKWACDEKNGQLKVSAEKDAAPGIAWIRMYDKTSASGLFPLLIEAAAVTLETEDANNKLSDTPKVNLPAVIAGRLAKSGDMDGIRVSLKAGEQLVASLIANRWLRSPMDAVLQIADLRGNVLAQKDDTRGLDPQLVYESSEDADVVVRVFAFPEKPTSSARFSGVNTYLYVLRLTTGPFLDHVTPILVGDEVSKATGAGWNLPTPSELKAAKATTVAPKTWYFDSALGWSVQSSIDPAAANVVESTDGDKPAKSDSLPVVFSGRIGESGQVDRLRLKVFAGNSYTAHLYAKSHGFLLDAVVRVVDPKSGKEVAAKDDMSRTDFDPVVSFKAKEDAEYELQVSDAVDGFGLRHCYAVWVGQSKPNVKLTVAADRYAVDAGKSVEIPVTIARKNGFTERLRVTAEGLPEGVQVQPATSEAKGDSSKAVTLKLSAADATEFQGNIRIVGVVLDKEGKDTAASEDVTFALRTGIELREIWLTVK